MLISHSKKFIFIHTYKVAGSSIRKILNPYSTIDFIHAPALEKLKLLFRIHPNIYSTDFSGHIKAVELRDKIPSDIFDGYFKFAFVRNPWDWQVSLYKFGLKDVNHHQHELFVKLGSFENYLDWRIEHEFRQQKDFVVDENGKVLVDFLGKFETLEQDFSEVCKKIGIHYNPLPHLNKSQTSSYIDFYTETTRQRVADAFKEDIELFKYTFDNL